MTRRPATAIVLLVVAAIVGPAAPATAAAGEPAPPSGTFPYELTVGGATRRAVVHVPTAVAARPDSAVPMVVHLHGGLGSPEQSIAATGLVEAADAAGFVVVFPEGTPVRLGRGGDARGFVWNGGRCCGVAARDDVDDVTFLRALIRSLEGSLPVDPHRVVMSGHSNGAMMAWRFACERGGVLAAVMPVAGSLETADPAACAPRGTSLLAVHGDADRNHPVEGGAGSRSVSGVAYRPFADSVAAYARAARCQRVPSVIVVGVETSTRYRGCARGAEVRAVVLAGADHPWPGGAPTGTALQGEPFAGWSATSALTDLVRSPG